MSKTVVICGAGVIGLCTAYYARRDGHRVIVIERGPRDGDRCSLGNAGLVVPSHFVPLAAPGATGVALRSFFDRRSPLRLHARLDAGYLRWCWLFWRSANASNVERGGPVLRDLALLSRCCYEELDSALAGGFGLQKRGLLLLCRTERRLEEEEQSVRNAQALGIPAEIVSAGQAAALEPGIAMSIAGAVHFPLDAHLRPQALVAALTAELERQGVEFRWSTEVLGWRRANGGLRAVETPAGAIEGEEFVLACGSWSARVARPLGLRIPLEAAKGYNLTLSRPPARPSMSALLAEASIAMTPMGEMLRFAGTLEFAGLDLSIDPLRVRAIREAVPAYYPQFEPEDLDVAPWSGLRPCSPDGLPYVGRVRAWRNLIVATGHAMMGVTLGPATGVVVADLLARRAPAVAIERCDPGRFG